MVWIRGSYCSKNKGWSSIAIFLILSWRELPPAENLNFSDTALLLYTSCLWKTSRVPWTLQNKPKIPVKEITQKAESSLRFKERLDSRLKTLKGHMFLSTPPLTICIHYHYGVKITSFAYLAPQIPCKDEHAKYVEMRHRAYQKACNWITLSQVQGCTVILRHTAALTIALSTM